MLCDFLYEEEDAAGWTEEVSSQWRSWATERRKKTETVYHTWQCITRDIQAMIKWYAEKVDKLHVHDLTYVAKSSSLHQFAKDKEAELKTVNNNNNNNVTITSKAP